MGNCKYCGKPAGLLRNKHAECEERHQQRERIIQDGRAQITSEVRTAIAGTDAFDILEKRIVEIEQAFSLPHGDRKSLLVETWENAVDHALEDGVLETEEEHRLVEFKNHFSLSQSDLDGKGYLTKVTKAAILRDVLNGIIPQRITIDGSVPINFQKGEQVVWVFVNSHYLEDKTRRQYVGGSRGVSVRIMKGVYYRMGAFKGHTVENTERVHIDTGFFAITNKNIYFAGSHKGLRVPYSKIVSFEPFSDGIGIMRDAASAKPQIFVTNDGWFTYNLVTNLSQL